MCKFIWWIHKQVRQFNSRHVRQMEWGHGHARLVFMQPPLWDHQGIASGLTAINSRVAHNINRKIAAINQLIVEVCHNVLSWNTTGIGIITCNCQAEVRVRRQFKRAQVGHGSNEIDYQLHVEYCLDHLHVLSSSQFNITRETVQRDHLLKYPICIHIVCSSHSGTTVIHTTTRLQSITSHRPEENGVMPVMAHQSCSSMYRAEKTKLPVQSWHPEIPRPDAAMDGSWVWWLLLSIQECVHQTEWHRLKLVSVWGD